MNTPSAKKPAKKQPKPSQVPTRKTHVLDASGVSLGRLATHCARLLMGKHKATFAPNRDTGDCVVVENFLAVRITGQKLEQKEYYRHSQFAGGLKAIRLKDLLQKRPKEVLQFAVYNMLPKTRLRKDMMKRLTIQAS